MITKKKYYDHQNTMITSVAKPNFKNVFLHEFPQASSNENFIVVHNLRN